VIQQRLQNPLALRLLQGEFHAGDTILVDVDPADQFTFTAVVPAEVVA
jgi:ATP-dependent Clp protease ATP-binding subunit ClpB